MGRWPRTPGWSPSEDAVTENVRTCAGSLAGNGAGLVVTSNGILKFFLKLVPGLFDEMAESRQLKVATGHCCAMRFAAGRWHMLAWNRRPEELSLSSLID
jgi:probable phosphoglycerate mutase